MRIYIDAAPVIYLFEGTKALKGTTQKQLEGTKNGDDVIIASELTRLECRIKPLKEGDAELLTLYDDFFASQEVTIILPNKKIWERATFIRVQYGFKFPDALHLACAIESGCDIFLTNDHNLKQCVEISVEVIS